MNIITSKLPWRRRPSGLVEINQSHPIAPRLVFASTLEPGALADSVTGLPLVPSGSQAWAGVGGEQWLASSGTYSELERVTGTQLADAFTLAIWFYRTTSAAEAHLLSIGTSTGGHNFQFASQNVRWRRGTSSTVVKSALIGWKDYEIRHLALTYDGTTVTFYENGRVVGTPGVVDNAPDTGAVSRVAVFSNAYEAFHEAPASGVAWVQCPIYTRGALSAAEVWSLYDPATRWSLYAPQIKRTYFALGAGGGAYTLSGGIGSYNYTGVTNTLKAGRLLTATSQTFNETGIAVTLRLGRALQTIVGAFTETGSATNFSIGRRLTATTGGFTETGQAANLLFGHKLLANVATFNIDGKAVSLIYSPAGSHTLIAGAGNFALNGVIASLLRQAKIAAATGTFTTTGVTSILRRGVTLTTANGAFTFTPNAATLLALRKIVAETKALGLSGKNVVLSWSGAPIIDTDNSECLFGRSSDAISILVTDLLPHDDEPSSLSSSLGG